MKKFCCWRRDEYLFGRLDQAKHILCETFEGKHFFVDGPTGNKIDCMFFPCTNKEKVIIDAKPGSHSPKGSHSSINLSSLSGENGSVQK